MPITARDKRRLDALLAIVKPANSLAARSETLSDGQRAGHSKWRERCDRFIKRYAKEESYAMLLNAYGPFDGLREDIKLALFGEVPRILVTDDEMTATQKYRKLCDG